MYDDERQPFYEWARDFRKIALEDLMYWEDGFASHEVNDMWLVWKAALAWHHEENKYEGMGEDT